MILNEKQVKRFDENDNGEILTAVDKIDRIAFDNSFLLIDRKVASTRSADYIHHYLLFSFDTEQTEEANSEKELLKLAKEKVEQACKKLLANLIMESYDYQLKAV